MNHTPHAFSAVCPPKSRTNAHQVLRASCPATRTGAGALGAATRGAILVAGVLAALAQQTTAQQQFAMLQPLATMQPQGSTCIVAGDIDGDGDLDLVSSNWDYYGSPRVYRNHGQGRLSADPAATPLPANPNATAALALGDIDGDGDLDIIYIQAPTSIPSIRCFPNPCPPWQSPLGILLNDGHGIFSLASAVSVPATNFALGDVDGDGDLDLVLGTGVILTNNGTGQFTPATSLPGSTSYTTASCLALADIDGDGDLDLVVGTRPQHPTRLFLNDGSGNFTDVSATQLPASVDPTIAIALGDIDGDGDLDLFVGKTGSSLLYRNDGQGFFTDVSATHLPSPLAGATWVQFGDLDGDGHTDLLVGSGFTHLRNDGSGRFLDVSPATMPMLGHAQTALLADVDGDGDLDLATGDFSETRLLQNLLRQLHAPIALRPGTTWQLDVYARNGLPRLVDLALPFAAFGTASIPLGPLGTLGLDPTSLVALPILPVPQPAGIASLPIPIPNLPGLVGVELYAQTLLLQHPTQERLTNVLRGVVVP